MGGTIQKLPHQSPAQTAGFLKRVGRNASKAPEASLPVVEVKKAIKLLAGQGKSVAAIEVLPSGGFRVIAAAKGEAKKPPNPFDEVLG